MISSYIFGCDWVDSSILATFRRDMIELSPHSQKSAWKLFSIRSIVPHQKGLVTLRNDKGSYFHVDGKCFSGESDPSLLFSCGFSPPGKFAKPLVELAGPSKLKTTSRLRYSVLWRYQTARSCITGNVVGMATLIHLLKRIRGRLIENNSNKSHASALNF